jgi:DNA polymerase III epsilon subunit-like protein
LQLIQQLKKDIGPTGSIVAYNAEFEISVLRRMALDFPEEAAYLEGLIERFVDLLVVFRNAWYYKPAMGGSASIKSVLPAIAPKFSYEDLTINNGGDASNIYLAMIKNKFNGDKEMTRKYLLEYCERDTFGMVILYNELMKVIIK